MNDRYSILINSCDAYSDVWPYFFQLLKNAWPNLENKIYLNTEKKTFESKEFNIEVLNILPNKSENIAWGERLIDALNRIDTKYVLFLLEDFFLEKPVQNETIQDCLKWMEENDDIIAFQLVPAGEFYNSSDNKYNHESEEFRGFGLRKQNGYYKLAAGPCLWRKDELVKLTKKTDSPWEWEFFGSFRTWLYKGRFYSRIQKYQPIFAYDIDHGGAVHRGKWVGYSVIPLLKRMGIVFDPGTRIVEQDWIKQGQLKSVKQRRNYFSALKNRLKMLDNIIYGLFIK